MNFILKRTKAAFAALHQSEQGTVLPLFGLSLFAVLAAVGISIDYGRAQMAQSRLHAAIDAAGLAAASVSYSRPNVNAEVQKFAAANFPQGHMGVTYTIDQVSISDTGEMNVTASGTVDTTFMRIFGKDTVEIAAYTQVLRSNRRGLELVTVLDNSGSMGSSGKRNAMVNAAKNDLLGVLYSPDAAFKHLYIGVVPFNQQVNIGSAQRVGSTWLRDAANNPIVTTNHATNGMRCSNDRENNRSRTYALTDTAPNAGTPATLFRQDYNNCDTMGTPAVMTAPTSDRARVEAAFDASAANGNTRIDLGTVWGWRMLSPKWRGLWAHENGAFPLDAEGDNDKAIIILTDGDNVPRTTASGGAPYYDPSVTTVAQANSQLTSICNGMKADGILVYTITFRVSGTTTQNLMRNCATKPDFYFNVQSNESIAEVFRSIAESLIAVRLSR